MIPGEPCFCYGHATRVSAHMTTSWAAEKRRSSPALMKRSNRVLKPLKTLANCSNKAEAEL